MKPAPRIAFYGDDFTGSTDTLMGLATGGLRTLLFTSPPDADALARAGTLDAIGIAGNARSLSPAEMDRVLPAAFAALAATGARVLHYKTCSTFDSAPHIGSIGHAVEIGRHHVANTFVPIVGGQPNLGRFCAFANLFAVDSHGGSVSRIDRHPTMSLHPVTPMGEADLRRHFAHQGLARVASFDLATLELDRDAHDRRMAAIAAEAPDAVLFDIAAERHLAHVGRLIWREAQRAPLLAVGPTGAAQALMASWRETGDGPPLPPARDRRPATEQIAVISGSRSPVTARQIEHARARGFEVVDLDAAKLARAPAADSDAVRDAVDQVVARLAGGHSVIAKLSEGIIEDVGTDQRVGIALAQAGGILLSNVLARVPLRRVAVAGGDSSSYAVQAMAIDALQFGYAIGPGSAVCYAHARQVHLSGLEILLKGGQMGRASVFTDLRDGVID